MCAAFSIEKPSIVASLPRPVDRSAGRYVVSEVHGGNPGSRKRKRSELVVGIDGEGLNIYDTQTSKLVTSYALPPQSSFTCPPCSIRLKIASESRIERRTYVSTRSTSSNLTLFHDSRSSDGTTTSAVREKIFQVETKPIVHLFTISRQKNEEEDLLIVLNNGEIQCLDGLDLETRWVSPASTISKNTPTPDVTDHEVRFVHVTDVHTARQSLLKGREDIFTIFSKEIDADGFNPHLLLIITSPKDSTLASDRVLHVVALPVQVATDLIGSTRSVQALLSVALPKLRSEKTGDVTYHFQASSGILHELDSGYLRAIDLSGSQPKVQSQLYVEDTKSFLPLSRTSVITASEESVNIYNRKFQSIQASLKLKSSLQLFSRKRKVDDDDIPSTTPKTCKLVAYSIQSSLVHAIAGNDLLAFHLDSRQDIAGRHRALDLLKDTLGRGILHGPKLADEKLGEISLSSLGAYIPGSDPSFDIRYADKFSDLDRFVLEEDVAAFEKLMAEEFGIKIMEEGPAIREKGRKVRKIHGTNDRSEGLSHLSEEIATSDVQSIPRWVWPVHKEEYPGVDPRFVQYALSRIFTKRSSESPYLEDSVENQDDCRLVITFFPPNVVHWLIETGNLNHDSIYSALRNDGQINIADKIPPGNVIDALAEIDPELKILFSLISNTHLDAFELLHAIRLLMQSLELLEDQPKLLTNGDGPELTNGELEAQIEIEQEKAATALSVAESYLGDSSTIRGQALSLTLAKLHACPSSAVVSALRSSLTSTEIVSLIYLLRFELARGAWTSRYLDTYESGGIDDDGGQESSIILVSGLLNCCIDAIGAGGWLSGDSMLAHNDHFESEELIQSLKLEVSAALEGIEEASYLKGLIGEMVRYGEGVQKALPPGEKGTKMDSSRKRNTRPITLPHVGRDARLLPFGLKSEKRVSLYRVGAGGEVQARTARDIGHLKSKKVGKYSRERIEI